MPSDPSTYYVTVDDYRTSTSVPNLVGPDNNGPLSDDQVKSLILRVMVEIDGYVGGRGTPLEDEQEFIFPRDGDVDSSGAADIPRPVTLAAVAIADAILQKRERGVLPDEVASEGNLGHSYSKFDRAQRPVGYEHWPNEAFVYLEGFWAKGGELAVPC